MDDCPGKLRAYLSNVTLGEIRQPCIVYRRTNRIVRVFDIVAEANKVLDWGDEKKANVNRSLGKGDLEDAFLAFYKDEPEADPASLQK